MAGFNRVILMGNLTRDPELKYTQSGLAVCEFGLAVNRRFRRSDGESGEETCFVDITVFGRQAETSNEYLRKGRPALIEGRLRYETWTSQDNQRRSKLSVVADNVQFLGAPSGSGRPGGGAPERGPAAPDESGQEPEDENIPF